MANQKRLRAKYNSAVICWRVSKEGIAEAMVIDQRFRNGGNITKFPSGDVKDCDGDDPYETAMREFCEETNLIIRPGSLIKLNHTYTFETNGHVKHFFAVHVDDCDGAVRDTILHDGGDEVSPPYPIPIKKLYGKLCRSHGAAVPAFLEAIAPHSKEAANMLW